MAVTSDFMSATSASAFSNAGTGFERPAHAKDAARLFARALRRFLGAVMILSAFGLWLMTGTDAGADLLLIKLVISLCAGVGGLTLMARK